MSLAMLKSLKRYWQSMPLLLPYSLEPVLPHTCTQMSDSGPHELIKLQCTHERLLLSNLTAWAEAS